MMIRQDTSLPLPLLDRLQENLAEHYWGAANDPHYTTGLDMEAVDAR